MIKKGEVLHHKEIVEDIFGRMQIDTLTAVLPLSSISDKGVELLDYWWVEDFDFAYIDRKNQKIVIVYRTEHYLPEGYEPEEEV